MAVLSGQWRTHQLKDTDYLRSMDSLVPFLEQEDSLPQWLSAYRDIAFTDPQPSRYKAYYYTFMALNAANTKKLGSAIYYSEKNNTERISAGLFEKGGLSHGDMFALFVYFGNRDYNRLIQKYETLLSVLRTMPANAAAGKLSKEQAFVALSILQVAEFTYYKKNDTAHMDETVQLARAILDRMRRQPGRYLAYRKPFDYLEHSIAFKEQSARNPAEAARLLDLAIADVRDTAFPEHMRADYSSGLYEEAVDFYSGLHKPDSIRHYLQLLEGIGANARESTTDRVFIVANEAYLLGDEGHYAEAYRQLRNAFEMRDSAFYTVSADKENNLYALAEADNAHAEMLRSEAKKRRAERANLYLYFIISLLVVAGGALFIVNRERERQRLLNLQISLARNFHDDIGPMLIYANALVKKALDEHPSDRLAELKTHIARIMNEVRAISHDLKSNHLGTIGDLAGENATLLEKIKESTGTGYTLRTENTHRPLSHIQYTDLLKITRELIGNSIKHAACKKIHLEIKTLGPDLLLHYSDDGAGMQPSGNPAGIGLQNIRERVAGLQGIFLLNNSWPRGYSIQISIPLI
ncbi:MAG TPA: ATP-binding protein [Puia sp.]|nr:ATP-binding protein [Puia sp.]